MTFPGVEGIRGPGPLSTIGWQVRQSRAGAYPGSPTNVTALDAMGTNAPDWGLEAEAITIMDQHNADPFPIAGQNFELNFDQYNNPTGTGSADPGYTGE